VDGRLRVICHRCNKYLKTFRSLSDNLKMPRSRTEWTLALFAVVCAVSILLLGAGCDSSAPKPYGVEHSLELPGSAGEVWAIGPAVNLTGHREVDPILQADLLFHSLQAVKGLTVIPVDRVAQAYAGLNIDRVETPDQAALICDLLGADALVIPTVTAFDPYTPPKMAASLALFRKPRDYVRPRGMSLEDMAQHKGSGGPVVFKQSVGIFDAGDGSVRENLEKYADGRSDPNGPMAAREYFLSMDRYSEFVYHQLIANLLGVPAEPVIAETK